MGRRGFFGRAFGGLLGAMFPSLFSRFPGPVLSRPAYRHDILYGAKTVNPKWACRLTGTDYPEEL